MGNNTQNMVPNHLGIIMDGNRRFAKRLMLAPQMGHKWGAKKLREVLDWCKQAGIKETTFYAFSVENFDRPKNEFDYLMSLFKEELSAIKTDKQIMADKIRIRFLGRTWMFPQELQKEMKEVQELTKENDAYNVNFAMAYGGRTEMVDAAKKIARMIKEKKIDVDDIDENLFAKNLYLDSDVDFVIRTSGEKRTSGFMLWQSHYAEFYFCEKRWPEFGKEDFDKALKEYSDRNRRFGK
ncbi:di-trans,poly-cis-decaprenylcistransferase [Candidatus Woesearchaeota archaeon]|nr:di-trans,poly-cis-decaprenylcistransferase [Candidatus Woesearchaeota archaeon]